MFGDLRHSVGLACQFPSGEADRQSVARFPASYTVEAPAHGPPRLLFHTSDGQRPGPADVLMSAEDCGLFVNRPYVTVRGIAFQNYLARDKWSTGIDLRVDHITVEDCASTNCSHGFIITGSHNTLRRCTTDDVGGGVYVGGQDATVEHGRFHKRRDTFMVPMYAQDDTGIQYYVPARGGLIRGNLCEGFGMGIFIKAHTAPYVVYSCENSVCRNNSFTFQGNDGLVIEEELGQKGKLRMFQCDHNNYGTTLREQPPGTKHDIYEGERPNPATIAGEACMSTWNGAAPPSSIDSFVPTN